MIDTHCHLTYEGLVDRADEVIASALAAGVTRMISIGTTPDDAEAARQIAAVHPQVYFAAGVHPHYSPQVPLHQLPRLAELALDEKCVAFGEMGVDFHYDQPPRPMQHEYFSAQLELVKYSRIARPIVIHCRKAVDDTLAIIRGSGIEGSRFVFHCFTETPDDARKVLDLGAMISFTGIATYKNAPEVRDSARLTPDDRIMIETDAPFLSPEPHRKIRPNEPKFLPATAAFLAQLRGVSTQRFVEITTANATRFFNLR